MPKKSTSAGGLTGCSSPWHGCLPGPGIVTRLKVLASLLTYRTDVPQEGRLNRGTDEPETRLSTFPTVFGEKAVVRLMHSAGTRETLDQLGLAENHREALQAALAETGGVVVFCGPAGSGKTTTCYACLREILTVSRGTRSIASLEDPVEVVVPGVAQSQVRDVSGFDLATAVRSVLRQDPDVLAVGEIRDADVASTVFQASLTGHLVVTTLHAGSTQAALDRLLDLGIDAPVLRAGLRLLVCQRLLRRLCDCARPAASEAERCGLPVNSARVATGCRDCLGTGYSGRMMLAELATLAGSTGALCLAGNLWSQARAAIERGVLSPREAIRVLGLPPAELPDGATVESPGTPTRSGRITAGSHAR